MAKGGLHGVASINRNGITRQRKRSGVAKITGGMKKSAKKRRKQKKKQAANISGENHLAAKWHGAK